MFYIGVDIGGTKIAVSLADQNCNLLYTQKIKTPPSPDFAANVGCIFTLIDDMLATAGLLQSGLAAIGLSCPGPLDKQAGRIVYVETTGWRDVPIAALFEAEYSVPVILENDACCAAYAEAKKGAGIGYHSLVYFTVSTGIGGGICINGKIHQGEHGHAGELGHMCVEPNGERCGCGGRGCVQLYSSGSAIAARATQAVRGGGFSLLVGRAEITAYDVELAVRAGDPLATEVWDNAMQKLGIAASLMYQSLNPGVMVFGGGVSNAWDLMEPRLLAAIRDHVYRDTFSNVRICKAKLGDVIGTMGAVLLAHDAFPPQPLSLL